jgi:hypothetical protein
MDSSQRRGRITNGGINLKKIEIVLWDEFDLEADMKLEMGHISVLTRHHPEILIGGHRQDLEPEISGQWARTRGH